MVLNTGRVASQYFYINLKLQQHIIMPSRYQFDNVVKSFIKSEWKEEDSISVEQAYSSDLKNSGRCVFLAQNLIHAYYYV